MTCSKCNRVHPKFKNGKRKKTCPTTGRTKGRTKGRKKGRKKGQVVKRKQGGKGAITDTLKKMAIAYAKKKGTEYLKRKGLIKDNKSTPANRHPKWAPKRDQKPRNKVVW